jgi:hypothetical protein
MAINVNDVYKTVLLILNKEQRGYMTPNEFNRIATQVQREIFERYFEDLNQQARTPQTDIDYADRIFATEEKLETFRTSSRLNYDTSSDSFAIPSTLYKLGNVTVYQLQKNTIPGPSTLVKYSEIPVEAQKVDRHEFNLMRRSKLLAGSYDYPIYLYEANKLKITPNNFTANTENPVEIDFIKKPADVVWSYKIDDNGASATGAYYWDGSSSIPAGASGPYPSGGSVNFELHNSEQTEVILNVLMYAGIIIRDPQVVQSAMSQVQQEENNAKT